MGREFRSPSFGSAAAATTPARLAEEFDEVLWRELPSGGIEVAVKRVDLIERLYVHDDGSTSQLATVPVQVWGWGRRLLVGGFALAVVAGVARWLFGVQTDTWATFAAGLAIFAVGWIGSLLGENMHPELEAKGGWYRPTKLNGWTPRASAQLAAVERIAGAHKGLAFVRDVGAATIDVRAPRGGGLDHYVVDGSGGAELTETPSSMRKRLPIIVFAPWMGAFLAVGTTGPSHFGGAGTMIALFMVLVVGIWLGIRLDPERALKGGHDGSHWIESRTLEGDSD